MRNREFPGSSNLHAPCRRPLAAAVSMLLIGVSLADGAAAQQFPAAINVSSLNGGNGFRLDGVASGDFSGNSVSGAGDINGDGIDDLIIGAYGADPNGENNAGSSYVVFGHRTGFSAALDLSRLDGDNGFRIDGVAAGDFSGRSVSAAGDVNGDGIDDLIIGAPISLFRAGSSYVVFGRSTGFSDALELSSLDGNNGFRLDGSAPFDYSGVSVSGAGDINGDGTGDLVVGARGANSGAGSSYVVFGRSNGFSAGLGLSSLDGKNGFRLDGVAANDRSGRSVSAAGDINGDGIDDLIIGATVANQAGSSYVVFGHSDGFSATLALSSLDGGNGFRLPGVSAGDYSGFSVSAAGDINGDGIDDLVIGAYRANPDDQFSAGSSYVVFGRTTGFGQFLALSSLDGTSGFRLDGAAEFDRAGISVSAAGDINGDGIDDLIIGARNASPDGNTSAGSSYVVFGRSTGFDSTLALSSLDGSTGFRIDGAAAGGLAGYSVSEAGDINGDGLDDLVIGAFSADPNGENNAGSSYVVFGGLGGPGEVPNLELAPNALDFEDSAPGHVSGPQEITVSSTGSVSLAISAVAITGPHAVDFMQTNDCLSAELLPGLSCSITVAFSPMAAGLRSATLQIESNAPTSPDLAALRGTSDVVFADGFEPPF